MKKIQSLEEFEKELINEEIPHFNASLAYNKINDKRGVSMFKFKKVVLVTCLSILTCSTLVFAATKLNHVLYNNKGEKIFEVRSDKKSVEENPNSVDSNQLRKDMLSKFHSQSVAVDSKLKDGEMAVKLYKDKNLSSLDYTINLQTENPALCIYDFDSKFVRFNSYDELKKEIGEWAKLPNYIPSDTKFNFAKVRYTLDMELMSQLRKEMLKELESKNEGMTYRIIKVPTKSVIRNVTIFYLSEKYGTFSLTLFHEAKGCIINNDELINKLVLSDDREAIFDKNSGNVFYADESQLKETSQLSPITWLDKPETAEFKSYKNPLIYIINKLGNKNLDEAKKILESIH